MLPLPIEKLVNYYTIQIKDPEARQKYVKKYHDLAEGKDLQFTPLQFMHWILGEVDADLQPVVRDMYRKVMEGEIIPMEYDPDTSTKKEECSDEVMKALTLLRREAERAKDKIMLNTIKVLMDAVDMCVSRQQLESRKVVMLTRNELLNATVLLSEIGVVYKKDVQDKLIELLEAA